MLDLYVLGMVVVGVLLLTVTAVSRDELGEYDDKELLKISLLFFALIALSWGGLGFLALYATLHNLLGGK